MFDYSLPPERIAQHPCARREDARLLVLEREGGRMLHTRFGAIGDFLRAGDLLVANDSGVVPARLEARKDGSGGRVELLLLPHSEGESICVDAVTRSSKPLREGQRLVFADGSTASVVAASPVGRARLRFAEGGAARVMRTCGSTPLPPYIRRPRGPEAGDRERYQTVYARRPGSVAAPTAGLHFSRALLETLQERGIGFRRVTLHVGAGTFTPIRTAVEQHRMEAEWCELDEETAAACRRTRAAGGRVVAIGTTTVRCLESAAGECFRGFTDLFIRPGFRFRCVDSLITNFHLPGSTLLALVSAFAGCEATGRAYREAVARGYRFYSYGDAMLVL